MRTSTSLFGTFAESFSPPQDPITRFHSVRMSVQQYAPMGAGAEILMGSQIGTAFSVLLTVENIAAKEDFSNKVKTGTENGYIAASRDTRAVSTTRSNRV